MIDAQLIQTIGAYASPIIGIGTAAYGYLRRKRLTSFFASKATLIEERNAAILERDGALREARTAEAANRNQAISIDALQTTVDSLQRSLEDLQAKFAQHQAKVMPMQEKIDALVDWTRLAVDYIVYLEGELSKVGVKPKRFMPPIPKIFADRFDVPETLRDD